MLLAAFFTIGLSIGLLASCSSGEHAAAPLVPVIERASCVLLRAVTTSGTVDEVCATADELAPLISEILAMREAGESPPHVAAMPPRMAAAMAPPPRRVARRRCLEWGEVPASSDGDASPSGARDE